jgi:redox-sensitive bicupin YhaK (pirin superfamily)
MSITVYNLDQQGKGAFGDGQIVESKPIAFPHEETAVDRVGPLFYWAWAKAEETFEIPLHPHKGFEILTYVLDGTVGHRDSMGNVQRVSSGGAQVMQTGYGVYHAEELQKGSELFQIWFEPHLSKAVQQTPTYHQYNHEEFPQRERDGVRVKTVIGEGAPVSLETKASMFDADLPAGQAMPYEVQEGNALAAVVVQGKGSVRQAGENRWETLQKGDFVVVTAEDASEAIFQADEAENLRIVWIEVPVEVDYPLYRK